jgi:excisionase family DNA binding protein
MDHMTVTEAAKYLGLSRRTIFRLMDRGILTGEKLGEFLWIIPKDQLDAYRKNVAGKDKHDPTRGKAND